MGLYRSILAKMSCQRCGAAFEADVQFKTGNDYLEVYNEGDAVSDLEPETFQGITAAYCKYCYARWASDHFEAEREFLVFAVGSGAVEARQATVVREKTARGAVELHVTPNGPPFTTEEIRRVVVPPPPGVFPALQSSLDVASIALFHAGERVHPRLPLSQGRSFFWDDMRDDVRRALSRRGWPLSNNHFIEVPVVVDEGHRLRVDRARIELNDW